ncbi:unnamed protein product [Protopolystoma xenopodis]|uniref:Uncharacterized protein n=1 Tax=Protopolystoma xenopodis TaxID=117903 RepID=A0A3S5CKG6_9PLAT|nr:unnamed protein product [Protopolystoma xenopodis]
MNAQLLTGEDSITGPSDRYLVIRLKQRDVMRNPDFCYPDLIQGQSTQSPILHFSVTYRHPQGLVEPGPEFVVNQPATESQSSFDWQETVGADP